MDSLENINKDVINCEKCDLYKERMNPVLGAGSSKAKIMFVAEAPGVSEDRSGVPFCGKAGGILDELLGKADLRREDVYITNILKCRPPENRNPREYEINMCTSYLNRQIELIKPRVICCLGNFATAYIMKKFDLKDEIQGISKIHAKVFSVRSLFDSIKIVALYHPAVVTYNINMKPVLEKDFSILRNI